MLIDDFNLLQEQAKAEVVSEQGMFLIKFVQGKMTCDVYQMFGFYVNIRYNLVTGDSTQHITAFADPKRFRLLESNAV